jgi:hypothetical protein
MPRSRALRHSQLQTGKRRHFFMVQCTINAYDFHKNALFFGAERRKSKDYRCFIPVMICNGAG